MKSTPVHRLRLVSLPEAVSFIILLVCVVLKSTTSFNAVPVMGWVHGLLFILYVLFWLDSWKTQRWSLGRAAWLFILSVLPTGGFFAERTLAREESAQAPVVAGREGEEPAAA
jgi:integral membrane protein